MKSKRINDLVDWLAVSIGTLLVCGILIFIPLFYPCRQWQKFIEYQQYIEWIESGEF